MTADGLRVQAKSQTLKSARITSVLNGMGQNNPVVVIIGKLVLPKTSRTITKATFNRFQAFHRAEHHATSIQCRSALPRDCDLVPDERPSWQPGSGGLFVDDIVQVRGSTRGIATHNAISDM